MNTSVFHLILALVRAYFTEQSLSSEEMDAVKQKLQDDELYNAAKKHDLTHLVGAALYKLGLSSNSVNSSNKFNDAQAMALYRYEMIRFSQMQICDCFEKNAIHFIPLKGAVLREFYPEPWLRTSCDIDVLIHEDDLDKAIKVLKEQMGYSSDEKKGSHDVSLFSQTGIHLELHYTLYENMDIDEIWELSKLKEGSQYHHLMSNEIFYCHQIAHIAKHFSYSGCGIRLFLDIWLLNKAVKYDKDELKRVLSYGNLWTFAGAVEKLIGVWFDGNEPDKLTKDMENYIFNSGIYGNLSNNVIINQNRKGGKFKYAIDRIFPSLERMSYYYPSLNKYKFLLPFCYVARIVRIAFSKDSDRAIKEMKLNSSVSQNKEQAVISLMNKLDLM